MSGFDKLRSFMDKLSQEYHVPGASVVVIHKGREVYRQYVGDADQKGRKVSEDTLFRLYSMSKPITCTAAMQLYERGAFKLDDPVGKYLPAFMSSTVTLIKPNGAYGWWNPPAKNIITVRNLFTMTAGLTYGGMFHPAEIFTSQGLKELSDRTDNKYTTRQLADMLGEKPLMFEPGAHWNYSFCHDVIGALIEVWSGKSFYEYLKENIFEPLGMKDTCFYLPEQKKSRLIDFYEFNGDSITKTYTETDRHFYMGSVCESGGAGLIGSLDDYARFAYCLANGGVAENGYRLIKSETLDLMRTNQLNETQLIDLDWEALKGYGYGLGVRTMMEPEKYGALSNIGEFGWNGMAGTYLLADPAEKLAIVYMQQRYPSVEEKIQPRLRNIVYECIKAE